MLSTLFLVLILIQSHVFAANSVSACATSEKNFQTHFDQLEKKYETYSSETFLKDNKPYYKTGAQKKIVYLLHGFIGSPYEMKPVANLLFKEGYTVVNDLIPGHGMSGTISNHFDEKTWRLHVKKTIQDLRACATENQTEINLVGFSTGALLIHDYIIENPDFKPQSVVLFSPFYKAHLAFLTWIKDIASWVTPTVAVAPLYAISRYQDIQVAVKDTTHYMQNIPLDTATVIQKLGTEVYNKSDINSEIPALLFVSENDQVLNSDVTLEKTKKDFKNLIVVLFAKKQKIPHHLMVETVSPVAEKTWTQAAEFILNNSATKK